MAKKESQKEDKMEKKLPREIIFRCQRCEKYKQLEEMRVVTRFFPLLVVCRDCEKEIR